MALRFRKRIKIFPGVHINIGSRGISGMSIGRRGASVSVNRSGTYLNTGMPGTGLSNRQKLSNRHSFANLLDLVFAVAFLAGLIILGIAVLMLLILFALGIGK